MSTTTTTAAKSASKFTVIAFDSHGPLDKAEWEMHATGCKDITRTLRAGRGAHAVELKATTVAGALHEWHDAELVEMGWTQEYTHVNNCCGSVGKVEKSPGSAVPKLDAAEKAMLAQFEELAGEKAARTTNALHTKVVRVLVDNPFRPGSKKFERFAQYTRGITVGAYLAKVDFNTISVDVKSGFIALA